MKQSISKHLLILLILIIAASLRLYKLDQFPIHLTPDEASLGYNAYSILHTGRDEYGQFLPLTFKSFGDYKPGLYIYLTVPFVAILGLNEWAVRLPSALMGILSIWLIYKITNLIFINKPVLIFKNSSANWRIEIGHFSALALSISPWHINFSRGAWEANVSLTLCLIGIYFFLKGLQLETRNLKLETFLSALFFGLTLWTYQGAKLSMALVVISLLIAYFRPLLQKQLTNIFVFLGILFIVAVPIGYGLLHGTGGRLAVMSLFSYEIPTQYTQTILDQDHETLGSLSYNLFHAPWLNHTFGILRRYFNYFEPRFFFFEGDWSHPNLSPPYTGMLHLAEILTIPIGLYFLLKQKNNFKYFLLIWLLLAPLPGSLSRDEVNSVRVLNMVIPLVILSGLGWYQLLSLSPVIPDLIRDPLGKQKILGNRETNSGRQGIPTIWNISLIGFLIIIQVFSLIWYLDSYYIHSPQKNAKYQQYGYKQIVKSVDQYRLQGNKVVVNQSYDQPYIYFLFYEKYDPHKYQQVARLTENPYGDVGLIEKIDDQLLFRPVNWSADQREQGTIFAADPVTTIHLEASGDTSKFQLINDIKYPDGHSAFRVVKVL